VTRDKEEKALRDALLRQRLEEIVELAQAAPPLRRQPGGGDEAGGRAGGGEVRRLAGQKKDRTR
jgi:hypothetical protein